MNSKKFSELALTKDFPNGDYSGVIERLTSGQMRLLNGAIGMSGESGELLDSMKKSVIYGKSVNVENIKEECGDILWYMALVLDTVGSSFEEVMEINVTKLAKRYPSGFNETDALDRKDKK